MPSKLNLSQRQKQMLLESEPDELDRNEGYGVPLNTGADYAVAKSLKQRGYGNVKGPGGSLPGMYWSNKSGLAARRMIKASA